MELKNLGKSTLKVSPLCLGGNVFGWTIDEKKSFEILDAFTAEDFNFIDTADVYSRWASGVGGESETIIGNWVKKRGNRNKIVLATKVGMDMGQGKTDVTKKYILKAAEASLKRLQTDHIDLYQTHKDDESVPVEEALEAYAQLIKEGKIRCIGASNFSAARLSQAMEASQKNNLPRYETLQPLYNIYDREVFEKELQSVCIANNISVINFYSLAAGFLTGKYRDENDLKKSVRGARVKDYLNERGKRILKALDEVSAAHKCNNASVAIAWLTTRASVAAPIASATSLKQLQDLFAGINLKLTHEELALINVASEWK
ncbi:MAG: aldo/keto reductase [Bacteroidetes bacterium]|nr:aldo/keto reductase [Bacteroidota bacterium]